MSLRKQHPPPPPPPSSRHVKNIEFGASLVAEAAVMMKHRLGEHTLANLAARMSESFFRKSFLTWYRSATDSRNFLVRAQRALCRLGLRMLRRALLCWQNMCMWARVLENLASIAISRKWKQTNISTLDGWRDLGHRRACVHVKTKRANLASQRIFVQKWGMAARISRVRAVQLARLFERKGANRLRLSFTAMVAQYQAEKGLYNINRLVHKTNILSGAVVLRAWREHIECNIHMEKAGRAIERRWDTLSLRQFFREWLHVHAFARIAAHASLAIAQKAFLGACRRSFVAWRCAHHVNCLLRCAGKRIAGKGNIRIECKAWNQWSEARAISRRLSFCYQTIKAKYQLRSITSQAFLGWRVVLESSRRLKCVDRRFVSISGQWCGAVFLAWRLIARRCRKFNLWSHLTDQRLKRIWLKNCFSFWSDRSLEYWRSWRKCQKFILKANGSICALHLVTWREKMRSAAVVSVFAAKLNTRIMENLYHAWSTTTSTARATAGRVDSGILRLAVKRDYKIMVDCVDLWHEKKTCRQRVGLLSTFKKEKSDYESKDRHLAAWMRRQDDMVLRRGRLLQTARKQYDRLTGRGLAAFTRNCEEVRACAHRCRCVQYRIDWNTCSRIFRSWLDLCDESHVRGKEFHKIIARIEGRWCYHAYHAWGHAVTYRRSVAARVNKARQLNAPRRKASWALSTWVDKHIRTMRFERLVLCKAAICCASALGCWHECMIELRVYRNRIMKMRIRKSQRNIARHLEIWHEHTSWALYADLVVWRAKASSANQQLRNAVSTWSQTVVENAKMRAGISIFALGMKTTARAAIFSAWISYTQDWKRRVNSLRGKVGKMFTRLVWKTFHGWKAVHGTQKLLAIRLKSKYTRLLQTEIRTSFTKWQELSYDNALMLRKYLQLRRNGAQHIFQRYFRNLRQNVTSSQGAVKAALSRWYKAAKGLEAQIFDMWVAYFFFCRRAKKYLLLAFGRSQANMASQAFSNLKQIRRQGKRLNCQVDVWDRRSTSACFDAWMDLVLYRKGCCIRASLMCLRSNHKIANLVFLFWEQYSSKLRTTRFKMIKMVKRVEHLYKRRTFIAFLEGVSLLRRRRLLQVKTRLAVERCRMSVATGVMMNRAAKAVRRRRMFSILLQRKHTKVTKV